MAIATETRQPTRRAGKNPLAPNKRTTKLQVCLSAQERAELDALAVASGHDSASGYIRAVVFNRLRPAR